MKKLTTIILAILFASQIFAQTGVVISETANDTPDESAILDVKSTNKGMLIPRIALSGINDIVTIPNAANGLFVFSENGNVPDGLYYWNSDISKWTYIITANNITDFGSGQVITTPERTSINSALQNISAQSVTELNDITSAGSGQIITSIEREKWNATNGVPIGTVISYMGNIAPEGWFMCNGDLIDRTTYSNLFAVLGTSCGSGNGSTTFHLPDFRGQFLRGVDGTANIDPERTIRTAMNSGGNIGNLLGSVQADAFKSHNHKIYYKSRYTSGAGGEEIPQPSSSVSVNTGSSGGLETRPKNAYVNYIIKY